MPHRINTRAEEAFAPDGALVDSKKARALTLLMDALLADLDLRSRPLIG